MSAVTPEAGVSRTFNLNGSRQITSHNIVIQNEQLVEADVWCYVLMLLTRELRSVLISYPFRNMLQCLCTPQLYPSGTILVAQDRKDPTARHRVSK